MPHLSTKSVRHLLFTDKYENSPKRTPRWQLTFDQFLGSFSYKIDLIKMSVVCKEYNILVSFLVSWNKAMC